MGEVIGFKRGKLAGFISEQARLLNLVEPITAEEFSTAHKGNDTAPSEYCAPESDGA